MYITCTFYIHCNHSSQTSPYQFIIHNVKANSFISLEIVTYIILEDTNFIHDTDAWEQEIVQKPV